MEMTLEEALRRGVEAHQRGDIQEAERFYPMQTIDRDSTDDLSLSEGMTTS